MVHVMPSGLQVQLRKWKLGDRKLIKNTQLVRQGLLIPRLLEHLTENLVDPGPYSEKDLRVGKSKGMTMSWDNVAWQDTSYAIAKSRGDTRDALAWSQPCIFCQDIMTIAKKLSTLHSNPTTPEGIAHLRTGEPLVCYAGLSDEDCIPYHTREDAVAAGLDIDDIARFSMNILRTRLMPVVFKLRRESPNGDLGLMQTCTQIAELVQPDGKVLTDYEAILSFMEEDGLNVEKAVDTFVSKHSGGLEGSFEHVCSSCHSAQDVALPFGPEFFMM